MEYLMESKSGSTTIINRRVVDYFSGCGYYDFQGHPDVIKAAVDAVSKYGISSATTRIGYGTNPVLLDVEAKAAQFFETKASLYLTTGCFGSPVLLEGLRDDHEVIFIDSESHYSSRLGTALVRKPVIIFAHRDPDDLEQKLKHYLKPSQRPLILCDGIFPISGMISPLPAYNEVLDRIGIEGAIICVDDAHAAGVIGEKGHGTFEYFKMKGDGRYSCGTFSKALGGHGGIIAGDGEFIKRIKHKSTLINACSNVTIPAAAATAKAIDILYRNPCFRKQLWDNVFYAKKGLRNIGFDIDDTPVPIICLHSQEKEKIDLKMLQLELFEKNIAVNYLPFGKYTSVPEGGAVRIALFSTHTRVQIDRLIKEIKQII
jgi:7-keto-8-aminopelargonate synthetase-like enzyme